MALSNSSNPGSAAPAQGNTVQRQSVRLWLVPAALGVSFFVLYAATAAPSLVALFDDSLEFQLVLPTFGIAHPTGYPLYSLLGGLWARLLPLGNWAGHINLLSALAGGVTVGLVAALAWRLAAIAAGQGPALLAAVAAALTFGLGPVWWSQTTVAEVYALHNLLLAATLLVVVIVPGSTDRQRTRRLVLAGLLIGLGLAHHRTTVLALPAIALYLWWAEPKLRRPQRDWLWLAGATLAPLLLYLYLPLRSLQGVADLHGSYRNTWTGFWDHVLARGYTGFFSASALSVDRTPAEWLQLGLAQLGWAGWVLALFGCLWLADRRVRKAWTLVLLVGATNLAFALLYRVGDQEVFLLPVWLCAAVLAGGGVAWVMAHLPGRWTWLAGAVAVLLLMFGLGRGPAVNRSQDWAVHDAAVDLAMVAYPPGSRVIGLEGETTALKYMQQAEGLGLAATPVTADLPENRRAALADALAAGAPAYLTRELEGIETAYSFSGEGPLVRVWPRGQAQAGTPQHALDVSMAGGQMMLDGYDMQRLDWAGGPVLRLALYWRPVAPLAQTLKVSVRLLDGAGQPLVNDDGAPAVVDQLPLRQVARTPAWAPQERVRDVYTLPLPQAAQEGPFTLQVILYDADTVAEVGRWEVQLPAQAL